MWILKGNKDQLLDLLQQNRDLNYIQVNSQQDIRRFLSKSETVFLWDKSPYSKPIPIPDLIICSSLEAKEDFLAWATTYINELRPFTSFCRVIDKNEFLAYTKTNKDFSNYRNLNNICLGLIICETITSNYQKQILTPLLAKSTFSFLFSQMALNGNHINLFQDILNLSDRLSKSLPNFKKNFFKDDLLIIWNIVTELLINNNLYFENHFNRKREYLRFIIESCYEIIETGKISYNTWKSFPYNLPNIDHIVENIGINTREIRVTVFEDIINILGVDKSIDNNFVSFIAAYLATQISPGSLKYLNLLQPYLSNYPSTILWYGFLTGLYKNSDINNYSTGLGWRILNELSSTNNILKSPDCDISIDELEILRRSNPSYIKNIRTENNSYIRIEVAPTIVLPLELFVDTKIKNDSVNNIQNFGSDYTIQLRTKIKELYDLTSILDRSISKPNIKKSKK